jgi:thioredoxin 1
MSVIELNDENFKKEVLEYQGTAIVDFFAEWCGPCKMMGPIFDETAEAAGEKAKFCKLNVDGAQKTAMEYGVMSIPTLIVFKNGKKVDQMTGVQSKEVLLEKIAN